MRGPGSYFLVLVLLGCSGGSDSKPDAMPDAPSQTLGPPPELAMACDDAVADVYTMPSNLPAMDDSHRGDIFHCATTESLSAIKVNAQIDAYNAGYNGIVPGHAASGFWSFRIAFRSERNTVNNVRAEGANAAFLLVPEKPLAGAPLIVFGHGSTGVAKKCAPTNLDLSGPPQDEDYPSALLRLAGAGYTVIAPDYNGFAFGTPGYFNAEDEAHAILDATRAAAKILKQPPPKVAFVGHSQGGHAVISAQTYAKSYGMQGELVGVATFAPFWTSMTLFAAAATPAGNLMTANAGDVSSILYAMEYAYSAAELREGAGHGVDVFQTDKQAAAKDTILGDSCYDAAKLQTLGATPGDFFEATYVNAVGGACAVSGNCSDSLAMKWKAWWEEDRPALDPTGAPVLAMYGGMDTFITTGRAQCARNRWMTDLSGTGATATVKYCYNPSAAHRDYVRTADADYAMEWIAWKAGIGPEPAACTDFPTGVLCASIPKDY